MPNAIAPETRLRSEVDDGRSASGGDRRQRAAVIAGAVVVGWILITRLPILGGDTPFLAQSSHALVACARDGVWSNCPGADRFGLQQHLVGMFLAWKGVSVESIVPILTMVNLACFVYVVASILTTQAFSRDARLLALAAVLTGPLLPYSVISFGEMLSVALGWALVESILVRRHPVTIGVLAMFACTSKETAFLAIGLIAAAALFGRPRIEGDAAVRSAELVALSTGVVAGIVANLGFNLWRYDELGNPVYGDEIFRTPGVSLPARSFLAVWVSPGGGALWFWFLGTLVALCLPVAALIRRHRREWAAPLLLLAALGAQTGVLALWWSPFGWYAWGPRLLLPTLAPAMLCALAIFDNELSILLRWCRRRVWIIVPVVLLTAVSAAANAGLLAAPVATLNWFYNPYSAACPSFPDFLAEPDHYYDCVHGPMTWRVVGSIWAHGLGAAVSTAGVLLLVGIAAILLPLIGVRRASRDQQRPV